MLAEAEKRDHRKLGAELDLFSFPDELGSGLRGLPPQGRRHQAGDGGLRPAAAHRGGLPVRRHPAHHQAGAVRDLRAPALLRRHDVPAHGDGGRGLLPQGHELPDAQPDLPVARAVLPRAAAAAVRVRLGLPLREVRRRARPDPGARPDHGRLALLRHCRSRRPTRSSTCWRSSSGCSRTSGSTTSTSSCRPATTPSDKFIGSRRAVGQVATKVLEDAATETGLELVPDPGGAAYYGPKISVQARDAIGRTWQMSTVQYDFNQPARFGLEYQAADGTRQQPVMIHSAKFGSIERFLGVLVEHYAGAFPPWLAPVQVVGIPITDEHVAYLDEVAARLRARGIRVEVDDFRRPHAEEDPQRAEAEGAVHADRGRRGRGQGRGLASAIATASRRTACRSTTRSRRSWRRSRDPGCPGLSRRARRSWSRRRAAPDARAALDAAPDGLHQRRAGHGGARRLPVLPHPDRSTTASRWSCARGATVYAVLNLHPYNPGHLMVVPYRHVADLEDLTADETAELVDFTPRGGGRDPVGVVAARLQRRAQPGHVGGRLAGRPPAPARRAALGRRRQLHHRASRRPR